MVPSASLAALATSEDIQPYKVHLSNKYLDLTRRKLELTRLPRESSVSKSNEWWEPKSVIEPLIDYWLEEFSWKKQATQFNDNVPQFRTTLTAGDSTVRVHFIYVRSSQANAVPLLLIPPFPFTNLSLAHLVEIFVQPKEGQEDSQAYNLVIPSLPGLGFSDALPSNVDMIETTAQLFNGLMEKLALPKYIVSSAAPSANTPGELDWKIVNCLATQYPDNCCGANFILPPLKAPEPKKSPLSWAKWRLATLTNSSWLGYTAQDMEAFRRRNELVKQSPTQQMDSPNDSRPAKMKYQGQDPTMLSYALCDSPSGLLLSIVSLLLAWGPHKEFSPEEIITMTLLSWLPGPESALRFWAHSLKYTEQSTRKHKAKVAITVFTGSDDSGQSSPRTGPSPIDSPYICPAWANQSYHVTDVLRIDGKGGLLAWERPSIIADGVRALTKSVLARDPRLRADLQLQEIASLERVTADR